MKTDDTDWLLAAADAFYALASLDCDSLDTWRDVVMWCALQAGAHEQYTGLWQSLLLANYPVEVHGKFGCIYRHISYAVAQNPNRNVLHLLMERVHLSPVPYHYDEEVAWNLLLKEVGKKEDKRWVYVGGGHNWEQLSLYCTHEEPSPAPHLGGISYLVYQDDDCRTTGGSHLIALANVWRELAPFDFPNRLLLIASDKADPTIALMSFVQLALMGMACYALSDLDYQVDLACQNGLFTPPEAIASNAYMGPDWLARCGQMLCGGA